MSALARAVPDNRLPAYVRLRDWMASEIAQGVWSPDQALPSENQLAKQHSISVGTVRRAMQQLVDEGLLERRRGSGTFLRRPAFDATLFRFFAMRDTDDRPSIPTSRLVTRAVITAPPAIARVLGAKRVIRTERLRGLSDQPLLAEDIFVPFERFAGFESLAETDLGPLLYPVYLERFGVFIARAVDDLSFGRADARTARHLGLAEGDPVAVIERTAFAVDGTAAEWRRAYGPAERFRYRSQIG